MIGGEYVQPCTLQTTYHDAHAPNKEMAQEHSSGLNPSTRIGMLNTLTNHEKVSSYRHTAWPPRSYSSMAEILGNQAGLAIYRRFATLNAQNLLYLQSELINLEAELKKLVLDDSNSDDEQRRVFQSDIGALKSAPADATAGKQWRKILEIRVKLKEYSMKAALFRLKCVQCAHLAQMTLCSNIPTSTSSRKPTNMTSASYENGMAIQTSVLYSCLCQRVMHGTKR